METSITILSVASVILLVIALFIVITPWIVAPIKALIRRDPGGAFVPHSQVLSTRFFAILYAVLGIAILIAYQPHLFQKRNAFVPTTAVGAQATQQRITERVAPRVLSGEVIGIVVGVVDASGRQVFGFGQRRLGAPPPDGRTVFELGEVSRTFTTLLMARLAERNQVRDAQSIRDLMPDSVSVPTFSDQTITVAQLASDVSGLPSRPDNLGRSPLDWFPPFRDPYHGYTEKLLDRFLSAYDLDRAPGARIEPSMLGMGLLGHVLTRAARLRYDTMLKDEITARLAMLDTRVGPAKETRDRTAQGYVIGRGSYRDWRLASPAHPWGYRALTGAGGVWSTANDLLVYVQAQLHLQASDLNAAMDETRRPRYRGRGLDAVAMGWSVRLETPSSPRVVWCRGATGGMRSFIAMDEARRVGVVVLANTAANIDELGFDLLRALP